MVVAGETSGDALAGELVRALRERLGARPPLPGLDSQPLEVPLAPEFFGAGGPQMAAAGVDVVVDMTRHSAIGLSDVLRKLLKFWRIFQDLKAVAMARLPDTIVCVDFSGFNRRWSHAIRQETQRRAGPFNNWRPKLVQYVSPQVWASRPGRAYSMEQDLDLLLALFPFEKDWYARRVPRLRVEFVGHPMLDRYRARPWNRKEPGEELLLLPGSRPGELSRHLPVMYGALEWMRRTSGNLPARLVAPSESLLAQAREAGPPSGLVMQQGNLPQALEQARVAIASTGTVTMECALFGVPTVAMYKTSWSTYQVGKRIVQVNYLAMPNLLADSPVYPEFVQDAATPEAVGAAALDLFRDDQRRARMVATLGEVIRSLGEPGATGRVADHILSLG